MPSAGSCSTHGGSSTRVSSASTCTELSAEINDSTSVCGVLASIGIDTCLSSAISNPVLEVLLGTQTLSVCHGCTAEVLILAEHVVDADGLLEQILASSVTHGKETLPQIAEGGRLRRNEQHRGNKATDWRK